LELGIQHADQAAHSSSNVTIKRDEPLGVVIPVNRVSDFLNPKERSAWTEA
jgi:hypothetical protein